MRAYDVVSRLAGLGLIIVGILCSLAIYGIVNLMITGASTNNWLMVIAGGILAYCFIVILGVVVFFAVIIGFAMLFD